MLRNFPSTYSPRTSLLPFYKTWDNSPSLLSAHVDVRTTAKVELFYVLQMRRKMSRVQGKCPFPKCTCSSRHACVRSFVYLDKANEMIQLCLLGQRASSRQLIIVDIDTNYVRLEQSCNTTSWSADSASNILQFVITIVIKF